MSRVLVDCDDVLIDLCTEWLKELNKIHHTNYTVFDIPDWDFTGMFDVDKSEILEPLADNKIWSKCNPIEDAAKYLKRLQDDGNEIYIVTATDYRNFAIKVDLCIKKYFPFINLDNIIRCNHKSMIIGDYLIDDNVNNLISDSYRGILFSRPHNRCVEDSFLKEHDIKRVYGWEDCYKTIRALE